MKLSDEKIQIDKLSKRVEELENLIKLISEEKNDRELLTFPWVGNLGQWYWLVESNQVFFNEKKVTNLGYESGEISTSVNFEFFTEKLHKDDYKRVMKNMRDHLKGLRDSYEVEYRIKATDNTYKWYYDRGKITKRDENGKPLIVSGIVFDISKNKEIESQLKIANEKLKDMVIRDELTQIFNRRHLIDQITYLIDKKEKDFSLILFDIDHFKKVNDKFGHSVGDKVLVEVCKVTSSVIKDKGSLFRFGGEEFIVLLNNSSLKDSIEVAEKIRKSIEKCPIVNCEKVTASFGVSTFKDGQSITEFIKAVDSLMYKAKVSGRNCIKF